MRKPWSGTNSVAAFVAVCMALLASVSAAPAADDSQHKTVAGLAVYLGVVPAEIVQGHPAGHPERTMHGGGKQGRGAYHVVAAIFDAASGARVTDAKATAQVSGLGLAGGRKNLETMDIAGTVTYGGFFDMASRDVYTIKLEILRPGIPRPVTVDFRYDRRR